MPENKVLICSTGASGAIYLHRLLLILRKKKKPYDLIISDTGKEVFFHELDKKFNIDDYKDKFSDSEVFDNNSFFAPPASGSNPYQSILIIPASMGTVGKAASGVADSLILRAIDVGLKENIRTVMCFREAPLNLIHINNLKKLKEAGADIFPLSPSFYFKVNSISELIDNTLLRILAICGYDFTERPKWK